MPSHFEKVLLRARKTDRPRSATRRVRLALLGASAAGLAGLPAASLADTVTVNYSDLGASHTAPGSGLLAGALPVYENPVDDGLPNTDTNTNDWQRDGAPGVSVLTPSTSRTLTDGRNGATVGPGLGGQVMIYNLGTAANLSELDFYFGWNDRGRNDACPIAIYTNTTVTADPTDPGWTLLPNSAAPTGFTTEAYEPGTSGVLPGANPNYTGASPGDNGNLNEVSVVDSTPGGTIAGGVQSIKLVFGQSENAYAGLDQINAFGTAVPEPATMGLLLLAGLPLLNRRRRRM